MKLFFALLVCQICISTSKASSEDIYGALNVPEVNAVPMRDGIPSVGVAILGKEIGGIRCLKTTVVHPHAKPKYSCVVSTEEFDADAVYQALNAKEESGAVDEFGKPISGLVSTLKKVDNLVCRKVLGAHPGVLARYSCNVKF